MDRRITLSQKRLKHAHILDRLVTDSSFTIAQAAEAMGLSERYVKRLKGEYKKNRIDFSCTQKILEEPLPMP